MGKRKVSPEGKIIALFTGLSEESQRMVMFGLSVIMSQVAPPPKSTTAPPVGKRSSKKSEGTQIQQKAKEALGFVLPDDPDEFHKGAMA